MHVGMRIPTKMFQTSGIGESNVTIHAGSYHLALREAGIEMCNIVTYSSILPKEIETIKIPQLTHGAVLETIVAEASCERGGTAVAGLIHGRLYSDSGKEYGGLVCEYSGSGPADLAVEQMQEMLEELHTNGYQHYDLGNITVETREISPDKMYGTALVALCFTEYMIPIVSEDNE